LLKLLTKCRRLFYSRHNIIIICACRRHWYFHLPVVALALTFTAIVLAVFTSNPDSFQIFRFHVFCCNIRPVLSSKCQWNTVTLNLWTYSACCIRWALQHWQRWGVTGNSNYCFFRLLGLAIIQAYYACSHVAYNALYWVYQELVEAWAPKPHLEAPTCPATAPLGPYVNVWSHLMFIYSSQ